MSFPYPIGQPPLNATPEDPSSPFYNQPVPTPNSVRAQSFVDGMNGRWCSKTQVWVPASRLKWFRNRPYLDSVTPSEPIIPPDAPAGLLD